MLKRWDFSRALGAAALVGIARPLAAQTPPPFALVVGTNAADDVTPLVWAKANGLFARAGLNVDVEKYSSGAAVTAAVIGGTLDVGRSSLLPLISARSRGLPVTLVAPAAVATPDSGGAAIIVLKGSPIVKAADLNGQTLPTPALNDYFNVAARAWIDANGGDSKTVKFIEMPFAAVLPALQKRRIAAGILTDPYLTNAIASQSARILGRTNPAIAPRFLVTAYFAMEGFVTRHRDALRRFAGVLHDSTIYTNANDARTINIMAAFTGIDESVLASMPRSREDPSLDAKDIQPVIDAAFRYGVIDRHITAASMIASLR